MTFLRRALVLLTLGMATIAPNVSHAYYEVTTTVTTSYVGVGTAQGRDNQGDGWVTVVGRTLGGNFPKGTLKMTLGCFDQRGVRNQGYGELEVTAGVRRLGIGISGTSWWKPNNTNFHAKPVTAWNVVEGYAKVKGYSWRVVAGGGRVTTTGNNCPGPTAIIRGTITVVLNRSVYN